MLPARWKVFEINWLLFGVRQNVMARLANQDVHRETVAWITMSTTTTNGKGKLIRRAENSEQEYLLVPNAADAPSSSSKRSCMAQYEVCLKAAR